MINEGRYTAVQQDNITVFLIGMRINKWYKVNKWLPVFLAMPTMMKELSQNPALGCLNTEMFFRSRMNILIQYWDSVENLQAYSKMPKHLKSWKKFLKLVKDNDAVAFYHETYNVENGQSESVYINMPNFGLGKVYGVEAVSNHTQSANKRLQEARERKNMNENVFIIGATGTIGGAVAESLKHSKYALTALIHKNTNTFLENNANLIKGSLTDVTLLEDHLQNHDYLFIAVNAGNDPEAIKRIEEDAVINVLKIAEDVGIKKVVYISGMYAEERFSNHPSESAKINVEKHLKESDLLYTIFKPGFIDVTLQQFVQGKQIMLLGSQPHPMHIVKLREMANDIADSFSIHETNYQTYVVTGREKPILLKDALEQYGKKFDPVLPVKVMPLWFMKILNQTFLKGKLTRAIDTMSLMQKYGEVGDLEGYHKTFSTK